MPLEQPHLYGVHARFWQQPHVLLCIFVGVGLYRATAAAMARWPAWAPKLDQALPVLALVLIVWQAVWNLPSMDHSANRCALVKAATPGIGALLTALCVRDETVGWLRTTASPF